MAIGSEQLEIIGVDTTPRTITVVTDDIAGGVAIDYSVQLEKISSSLENLVTQTTRIADALETVDSTNLATSLVMNGNRVASALETTDSTNLADNIAIVRGLAEGGGIHTIGAYEWLGLISSYINYIEKGEILNKTGNITDPVIVAQAIQELETFIEKIKSLPTNF